MCTVTAWVQIRLLAGLRSSASQLKTLSSLSWKHRCVVPFHAPAQLSMHICHQLPQDTASVSSACCQICCALQKGYELRGAAQLDVQQDVGSTETVSLTLSTPPCFGPTCGRAMELRTSSSNVQKVAAAAAQASVRSFSHCSSSLCTRQAIASCRQAPAMPAAPLANCQGSSICVVTRPHRAQPAAAGPDTAARLQGRASISMALAADSSIMLHGLLRPDCPEPAGLQLSPVELVVMEGISALLGQLPASWRGESPVSKLGLCCLAGVYHLSAPEFKPIHWPSLCQCLAKRA